MLEGFTPWPEDLAEQYRREGLWRGIPLSDLGREWARTDPSRIAVAGPGTSSLTYGQLDERADQVARGLISHGLKVGDRVVLQLGNGPGFVEMLLGCFRAAVIPALALTAHGPGDIRTLIEQCQARAYVGPAAVVGVDPEQLVLEVARSCPDLTLVARDLEPTHATQFVTLDQLRGSGAQEVLPIPDPTEVAFFFLTGGTTGRPKLVPRTHDDYRHQIEATAKEVALTESGGYLAALPAAHNAALGCPGILGALLVGARVVLAASPSPDEVFDLAADHPVTVTTVMPSVLALWIDLAADYDHTLEGVHIEVGGARSAPELIRAVAPALGASVSHWFGMAEGILCFTRPSDSTELAATTQGRPLNAQDELIVVDEAGEEVPPGAVGELLCRGPSVLRGYFDAAEYNATHFTADGFLRTGDLARLDEMGNLVIEGRIKDVVNRGGEKIGAEEVEELLSLHPRVSRVAVVAVPDSSLGERVGAVVVPVAEPPSLSDLREHMRTLGVAEFKFPERLAIVDELPLTTIGKIDKKQLLASVTFGR